MGRKRKQDSSASEEKTTKGAIYLGHIPRSFVEPGMEKFFSQFGKVTRVKLARSKRTGNPKGYGFIEFESNEVAEIAADTMSGYLMCGRVLKCNTVPEIKPGMFRGHKKPYHRVPRRARAIAEYNKPKSAEQLTKQMQRLAERTKEKRKKLEALGIDYTIPSLEVRTPKRKVFKED